MARDFCALMFPLMLLCGCQARLHERPVDPVVFQIDYDRGERRMPQVNLPARLGIARVGYPPRSVWRNEEHGQAPEPWGALPVPARDVAPTLAQLEHRLDHLDRIVVLQPEQLEAGSRLDPWRLRSAAGQYGVDLLFVYNTTTKRGQKLHFPLLTLLTFGLIPNATAESDGQARAALVDVRTGYVFATFSENHHSWGVANAYTLHEATEQAADRSRHKATSRVLRQLEASWPDISRRIAALDGQLSEGGILPRAPGSRYQTIPGD